MINHSSFDDVYEELFPVIFRFVSFRVPQQDVEDVTAEIIAKVWRALSGFEGNSSLKSWALSIANNHVVDYYRQRKKAPAMLLQDDLNLCDRSVDISESLTTWLSISQALSKLSDTQVTVIQLRLVEGFSASEVAKVLGISQQAVDSLLYRAKKSFRKFYESGNMGGCTNE